MNCPSCRKEIVPDAYFCNWCSDFVPSPSKGAKPGLFRRWVALMLDPLIAIALYGLSVSVLVAISRALGLAAAFLLPLAYVGWFLSLLRQGLTPGKKLLGLQVVDQRTGQIPGFGKMFVREVVGRFVSGLLLGLGYLWAIIDKNGQAWHDKIAGTVVLKLNEKQPSVSAPSGIGIGSGSGTSVGRAETVT